MRVRYSFSCRRTRHIENITKQRPKVPEIAKQVINEADIILEVLDARFIDETRIPELEEEIKKSGKRLIYILNKSDLLSYDQIKKIKEKLNLENLKPYVFISCSKRKGKKDLKRIINVEAGKTKIKERKIQIGIIGYPNTGKSSLINFLTGRYAVKTSPKAGFTRGIQKIKFSENVIVLDTPGVISEKEYSHLILEKIAKHAKISARTWSEVKEPEFVVAKLMKQYPGVLEKHYNINAEGNSEFLIETLGKKKNWLIKGSEVDIDRTARFILKEWQEGKIKIGD
ncbi:MAG: GTPase [Candidatus Pacearchaeota archaeon]